MSLRERTTPNVSPGAPTEAYKERNLRYSQVVPFTMTEEKNSGTNLPAQIDLYADKGNEYKFLFITKGGGSANKTFLYQQTKALLNEKSLLEFFRSKLMDLGTSACPPYHLAVCIGGTSAEMCLATVKKASAGYLDQLPTSGNEGGRCFRDLGGNRKSSRSAGRAVSAPSSAANTSYTTCG